MHCINEMWLTLSISNRTCSQVRQLQQRDRWLLHERRGPVHHVRAPTDQQSIGRRRGLHGVELRGRATKNVWLCGSRRQASEDCGCHLRERGHRRPVQGDMPGVQGVPVPFIRLQRDGCERVPRLAPQHVQPVTAAARPSPLPDGSWRHHLPDVVVLQREDRLSRRGHGRVRAYQPAVRWQGICQESAEFLRQWREEHPGLRPTVGLPQPKLRRPAGSTRKVFHRNYYTGEDIILIM